MGLFRRRAHRPDDSFETDLRRQTVPLHWPAAAEREGIPDVAAGVSSDVVEALTYTPSKRSAEGVPPEDLDAWMDASWALAQGLTGDLIAWGPVTFAYTLTDEAPHLATAALSDSEALFFWHQPGSDLIELFHGKYDQIVGADPLGSAMGISYEWSEGIAATQSGKYRVADAHTLIMLRTSPTDGHANRRSMSVCLTMLNIFNSARQGDS